MYESKKERLHHMINEVRNYRFCGPSDDPDEQTSVTTGFQYLLIQIQHLAAPLLPDTEAALLKGITVDVHSIYTAYLASAQLDALLPDIEAAIECVDDSVFAVGNSRLIIEPKLIKQLSEAKSARFDVASLAQMCREINSCFASGNFIATTLLMRAVLNYIPPLFGYEKFPQVVAQSDRSLKDNFDLLENGLRKIADFHTHRRIGQVEFIPSSAQVEPYKPQFELLMQEILKRLQVEQQK